LLRREIVLDQLVGDRQQRFRDGEAERLGAARSELAEEVE
jgi:hypothetical protein